MRLGGVWMEEEVKEGREPRLLKSTSGCAGTSLHRCQRGEDPSRWSRNGVREPC